MNLLPVIVLYSMVIIEVINANLESAYYDVNLEKKTVPALLSTTKKYTAFDVRFCTFQCQINGDPVANYLSSTKECECLDKVGTLEPAPGWKTVVRIQV